MAKKINEVAKITAMNSTDYIPLILADGSIAQISKTNLANAVADSMRTASDSQNGLMEKKWEALTKRNSSTSSMLIYLSDTGNISLSLGFLINLTAYGGGPVSLYFLTLYRSANVLTRPGIRLYLIAGTESPSTSKPRFKILNDDNTGLFKLFLERNEHTPGLYVSILGTYRPSYDKLLLTKADDTEVAAATYIELS